MPYGRPDEILCNDTGVLTSASPGLQNCVQGYALGFALHPAVIEDPVGRNTDPAIYMYRLTYSLEHMVLELYRQEKLTVAS